jgi:hypothetical protein
MQYLYLVQCQQFYKIGIASDVQSRLAQLATGNPFELELLAAYGFENANPIEIALHQRFSNNRKKGEWFSLDNYDLDLLANVCMSLGGLPTTLPTNIQTDLDEDELLAMPTEGIKFDFAAMFADGWIMDVAGNGRGRYEYWCWRKRRSNEKGYIYGGRIADLPYPNLDEMRRHYRVLDNP